mmetsp:Transcript_30451/g.87850  ORF Transcript_30451/g.87850 Transcript_30451/m.87850 type:complete len:369 (+) Transcript_30451:521-1627(+)
MPINSLAALFAAIVSLYSAFSALRCSVASATLLSKALIPAFNALISSVRVAMPSFASSITVSKSEIDRSNVFFLSSATSNSLPQYSFLLSSSTCSVFSVATSSSTSLMTFSNPPFCPCKAKLMKSRRSRPTPARAREAAFIKTCRACSLMAALVTWTCMKLALELGKVLLNNSSASSSLRILIVSAKATISCARIFCSSSCTAFLEPQFFSRSARNFLSSSRPSATSSRSFFMAAMETPNSAILSSFSSMDLDSAAISFFLDAISPSKDFTDSSSAVFISLMSAFISSPICFKMPITSPLIGAYPSPPERKAMISSRSASIMSLLFTSARKVLAAEVCRNAPAAPFSRAPTALATAAALVVTSAMDFS